MKILVVSTPIFKCPPSGYSGLEAIAYHTAVGLASRGHEVAVVAPEGSSCGNVELIPTGPERSISEKRAYDKYWHRLLEFDAIVDHSWEKWSYILKMEGKLKAPILGVLHAPVNTMYAEYPPVEKPCMVCISHDQASHLHSLHGVESKVCYNGVDVDYYKSSGIPKTDRFLFLARFSTIKGPLLAIEASRKAGASLDLVGDSTITNEPEYLDRCYRNSDGSQIKIVGPATRGECVHWFSRARAFLHPNKQFREPIGLAPVEAALTGLPVIAWDNGAMRETVKHGESGFLVKSVEHMAELIRNNADKDIKPESCREWASQFSIQKMVERYEQLCVEAVEGGGW